MIHFFLSQEQASIGCHIPICTVSQTKLEVWFCYLNYLTYGHKLDCFINKYYLMHFIKVLTLTWVWLYKELNTVVTTRCQNLTSLVSSSCFSFWQWSVLSKYLSIWRFGIGWVRGGGGGEHLHSAFHHYDSCSCPELSILCRLSLLLFFTPGFGIFCTFSSLLPSTKNNMAISYLMQKQ